MPRAVSILMEENEVPGGNPSARLRLSETQHTYIGKENVTWK